MNTKSDDIDVLNQIYTQASFCYYKFPRFKMRHHFFSQTLATFEIFHRRTYIVQPNNVEEILLFLPIWTKYFHIEQLHSKFRWCFFSSFEWKIESIFDILVRDLQDAGRLIISIRLFLETLDLNGFSKIMMHKMLWQIFISDRLSSNQSIKFNHKIEFCSYFKSVFFSVSKGTLRSRKFFCDLKKNVNRFKMH